MLRFCAQAVLANEHKGGQENRFEGHNHGQEAVWEWVEWTHADTAGVQQNPHAEPHEMHIHKNHAPRNRGDGVGEQVLHASRTSCLEAQLDHGANIPLDDLAQGGIVVGVFFWFLWVQAVLLDQADVPPYLALSMVCQIPSSSLDH